MIVRKPDYVTTRILATITLGLLLILFWTTSVSAQTPTAEEVYRIADKLNCPLCQGLPLSDCPLVVCEQMRALIKEKLANGETEAQIIQYFVDQYGEQVLNAPPVRGFNLLVWVLPIIGLVVGVSLVTYTVRGWLRSQKRATPVVATVEQAEQLPQEYLERLQKELEELD